MRIFQIIVIGWIVLTTAEGTVAKSWRGIIPLTSTRTDVERLLGQPTGTLPRYYLEDSTVFVEYSKCRCGDAGKRDGWNVPPDTVVLIRVGMKGIVKLTDLKLDLSKFDKEPGDEDVPGQFSYVNREEGFAIETGSAGYVSALIYMPPAKDDHLRCPKEARPNSTPLKEAVVLHCADLT